MRAVESKGKEKKEKNSHPTKVAVFLCIKNSPCASTCPALWFPEFRTLQRKRFPKFRNCIFCMCSPCVFYLLFLYIFVSVYMQNTNLQKWQEPLVFTVSAHMHIPTCKICKIIFTLQKYFCVLCSNRQRNFGFFMSHTWTFRSAILLY